MDIILELWDTFIGDRLYSTLLPASLSSSVSLPAFVNAAANTSMALFGPEPYVYEQATQICLLYTSDAADDMQCVDLGCRRIIKKKKKKNEFFFFKQKTAYFFFSSRRRHTR